jgi:hypothetical protein
MAAYTTALTTADQVLINAIAAGYDGLSTRDIMLCVLQGAASSGGGVFSGSGTPASQTTPPVPAGTSGVYWDYTNKILYMWNPVTKAWEQ